MSTILSAIASVITAAAVAINAFIFPAPVVIAPSDAITAERPISGPAEAVLGADGTLPLAGTVYTLAGSGVSGSATSIVLSSLTIPQTGYEILDADLSSTFYLTLEPGNRTRQEIVSCTTVAQSGSDSTATLSGCTRGLLPFSPYTASSTYQFAHGGGTAAVFSNPPQLYNEFTSKSNDETITGLWLFPEPTNASSTATKNYADALAIAGAPNGSLTQKGIYEEATKAQTAAGTATDTTGADLIAPNSYFNATQSATTTVPVTGTNGKLSQSFLDLTEGFTFSGNVTSSAQVALSGTTTISRSLSVTATSTVSGATTFSTLPTFTNTPTNGTDGANKTYVDVKTSVYTASSGSKTITASTSTLMTTIVHPASSTIAIMCDVVDVTANSQPTFTLRNDPTTGDIDACSVGTGAGNPAGCTLLGFVTPGAATSTPIYINDSNAGNEEGNCIAFVL